MTKLCKSRAKLCANFRVNPVQNFVDIYTTKFYSHYNTHFFHIFILSFHRLLNNIFSPVITKTFPLLHRPYYYYYDIYKYNNN